MEFDRLSKKPGWAIAELDRLSKKTRRAISELDRLVCEVLCVGLLPDPPARKRRAIELSTLKCTANLIESALAEFPD